MMVMYYNLLEHLTVMCSKLLRFEKYFQNMPRLIRRRTNAITKAASNEMEKYMEFVFLVSII